MTTYEEALAAPTAKGGKGWKHADETSALAAAAQALQHLHPGLAPRLVFEGAQKKGLTARQLLELGSDWRALDDLMWVTT
jgi:alkylhydroperoxidase family enzyme